MAITDAAGPAPDGDAEHVLVVADGDVPARDPLDDAWPGWLDDVGQVIAADGGFVRAEALGLRVSLLVGDLDSVDPDALARARAAGIPVRRVPTDKDESDTELALLAAIGLGARRITVLGAFGGARLDHALANVGLLAHAALRGADVVLLDARARVALVTAPDADGRPVERLLPGPVGGIVSLLPLGDAVSGVTTVGLRYGLRDDTLSLGPARGLSNVRTDADAAVSVARGRLLVVEAPVGPGRLSSPR